MTIHDDRPSLEQWGKLYEVARNIRQLEPWKYLWDTDLITIMLPGREEPIYCSVMGRIGECYAIGVYPGFKSVNSFYRIAESSKDDLPFIVGLEQDCLICNYGDRVEVAKEDREVYKALGLRFRGQNEWIYFRSMAPGYVPWHIDSDQADLLLQVLQNLTMALIHLKNEKIKVDFDSGETLLRFFSPEDGLWYNNVVEMPPRLVVTPRLIVGNEVLMAKLKKHRRNGARLEFDVVYLPAPIQENKGDRPFFPRFALLMDKKIGIVIDQHMARTDDYIEVDILEMLTRYIMKSGRPASINVRDDRVVRYIGDFCDKLAITLIEGKGVPYVDDLLKGILASISMT